MLARYYSTDTGMVVIDDMFTPDALAELRAVVDESVVWHDDGYGEAGRGYLGAYINGGFGTGLLFQVCGTHSRVHGVSLLTVYTSLRVWLRGSECRWRMSCDSDCRNC